MPDPTTPSTDASAGTTGAPPDQTTGTNTDGDLGPAGEKALEAWKERARKAEAEARDARKVRAELEELRTKGMSDTERAIEEARKAGRAEAEAELRRELLGAKAIAAATGRLANPEDATVFLDLDGLDPKGIGKAIDKLLEERPYLAAGQQRPTGTASVPAGARGGGGPAGDMNALIRRVAGRG